ncbi:MAG: hypothetical protein MZV64_50140 [Ignavibacteriales bacterium]|nr:hypothetical protein [Ignavibacteriales bacterium]
MGEALAGLIDDRLTSGLVVVPGPVTGVRSRLEYLEASHPVPDARSVEAGPPGPRDRVRRRREGPPLRLHLRRRLVPPDPPGRRDLARQKAPSRRRPHAGRGDHPGAQHRAQAPVRDQGRTIGPGGPPGDGGHAGHFRRRRRRPRHHRLGPDALGRLHLRRGAGHSRMLRALGLGLGPGPGPVRGGRARPGRGDPQGGRSGLRARPHLRRGRQHDRPAGR